MNLIGTSMLIFVAFAAGWGWGCWVCEKIFHKARADAERNRIYFSMPADERVAADTLALFSRLMKDAEQTAAADSAAKAVIDKAARS